MALTVLTEGLAVTIHGRARVVSEQLVAGVVAIEIVAEQVQDHDRPEFEIEGGVRWRWLDSAAAERDAEVWSALEKLALG